MQNFVVGGSAGGEKEDFTKAFEQPVKSSNKGAKSPGAETGEQVPTSGADTTKIQHGDPIKAAADKATPKPAAKEQGNVRAHDDLAEDYTEVPDAAVTNAPPSVTGQLMDAVEGLGDAASAALRGARQALPGGGKREGA